MESFCRIIMYYLCEPNGEQGVDEPFRPRIVGFEGFPGADPVRGVLGLSEGESRG